MIPRIYTLTIFFSSETMKFYARENIMIKQYPHIT